MIFFTEEFDCPFVQSDHATENVHQSTFPCPVLADQSQGLAFANGEGHFIQGPDAEEAFTDTINFECLLSHISLPLPVST